MEHKIYLLNLVFLYIYLKKMNFFMLLTQNILKGICVGRFKFWKIIIAD